MHGPLRLYELGRVDLVPLPLVRDAPAHGVGERCVVPRAAKEWFDVRLGQSEQAIADLAVRGEPQPVATPAKWPRHGGDDADAAAAVHVPEIHCGGTGVVVLRRRERSDLLFE